MCTGYLNFTCFITLGGVVSLPIWVSTGFVTAIHKFMVVYATRHIFCKGNFSPRFSCMLFTLGLYLVNI